MPARSRHCNKEQVQTMSLELICKLWEDWIRDELEPGELPICHSPFDLRAMGRGIERQRKLFLTIHFLDECMI